MNAAVTAYDRLYDACRERGHRLGVARWPSPDGPRLNITVTRKQDKAIVSAMVAEPQDLIAEASKMLRDLAMEGS